MFRDFTQFNELDQQLTLLQPESEKLSKLVELLSTCRTTMAFVRHTAQQYAQSYKLVERLKITDDGDYEDVTPDEQLTVPENMISRSVARLTLYKSKYDNFKKETEATATKIQVFTILGKACCMGSTLPYPLMLNITELEADNTRDMPHGYPPATGRITFQLTTNSDVMSLLSGASIPKLFVEIESGEGDSIDAWGLWAVSLSGVGTIVIACSYDTTAWYAMISRGQKVQFGQLSRGTAHEWLVLEQTETIDLVESGSSLVERMVRAVTSHMYEGSRIIYNDTIAVTTLETVGERLSSVGDAGQYDIDPINAVADDILPDPNLVQDVISSLS